MLATICCSIIIKICQQMLAIIWCSIIIIHLCIGSFIMGYLGGTEVIAVLCILNLALTLHYLLVPRYSQDMSNKGMLLKEKGNLLRKARPKYLQQCFKIPNNIHPDSLIIGAKTKRQNLYIEAWKKRHLAQPVKFPLDRLAYINSKFQICTREHLFLLRNSHLKKLALREDYRPAPDYTEDPHPRKLVTDLCATYIHRRAMFYRARRTQRVSFSQFTAAKVSEAMSSDSEDDDDDEGDRLSLGGDADERSSEHSEKINAGDNRTEQHYKESIKPKTSISTTIWRRLSRMSHALIGKTFSKNKEGYMKMHDDIRESDLSQGTCYHLPT